MFKLILLRAFEFVLNLKGMSPRILTNYTSKETMIPRSITLD